jgi:DNA-binding response OmpR family regulator
MPRRIFLIVEDNSEDAFLIRRAFLDFECEPFVCRNTSEARAYLRGAGMYRDRGKFPFPEVIISDLRSGAESDIHFLRWVRTQEEMNGVPFILLTDGGIPEQMALALEVGATKAVAKPTDSAAFHDLMVGLLRELCGEPCSSHERLTSA